MIAYLDLAGGLAGDIFIACCLEAGADKNDLTNILKELNLGDWELETDSAEAFALRAGRVDFRTEPSPPHRSYLQIKEEIIEPAALPDRVKERALTAFEALARAEGGAHGIEPERVHFHEVGADDSILDLVGAAACLELLGVDELYASPVPLSRGVGSCQHGLLPLPPPATVALLKGKPVFGTDSPQELVTPTGAAILGWVKDFGRMPAMELQAVGAGVGRKPPRRGLTRLFVGRPPAAPGADQAQEILERVSILSTTIDDMNPELYGQLMEALLQNGALDVVFMPVQMKKNRPGVRLEAICRPENGPALTQIILRESTTLGVRLREESRLCLERRPGQVEIEGGAVSGKWVKRPGDRPESGRWDFRPEYEDCRRMAEKTGRPVAVVYEEALAAAQGKEP